MNKQQIARYVIRYLEATDCHIIEKRPTHVTVKLSDAADRALTNRPYYWNFVERTGVQPETMTFTFVFDPEHQVNRGEYVTHGSRRLDQLFQVVKTAGKFVQLFEEQQPVTPWLGINFKVDFTCDMKRSEIHSLGISLTTGQIIEQFQEKLLLKKLTPRLPKNVAITAGPIKIADGAVQLESYLEHKLLHYDHGWADSAYQRWQHEQARITGYYEPLRLNADEQASRLASEQFAARTQEIEWQYRPRLQVFVMNCGIFHLHAMPNAPFDQSR